MDASPPCLQVYASVVPCRRVKIGQGFVLPWVPAVCAQGRMLSHGGFSLPVLPLYEHLMIRCPGFSWDRVNFHKNPRGLTKFNISFSGERLQPKLAQYLHDWY